MPTRKSPGHIQRAHDIMHFLATPEAPPLFRDVAAYRIAHDTLAWVLGFECGKAFQNNLEMIVDQLRAQGYQEVDVGQPITAEEAKKRGLAK